MEARGASVEAVEVHGREELIEPGVEAKLLAVARQPLRDVLFILRDMGLRPAEVLRMRWGFAIGRKADPPRLRGGGARDDGKSGSLDAARSGLRSG